MADVTEMAALEPAPIEVALTRLRCRRYRSHGCQGRKQATRTQRFLKVGGRDRLHVAMKCPECGDETWSREKNALHLAREMDLAARGVPGDEPFTDAGGTDDSPHERQPGQ